jgi:hypothetical protein
MVVICINKQTNTDIMTTLNQLNEKLKIQGYSNLKISNYGKGLYKCFMVDFMTELTEDDEYLMKIINESIQGKKFTSVRSIISSVCLELRWSY